MKDNNFDSKPISIDQNNSHMKQSFRFAIRWLVYMISISLMVISTAPNSAIQEDIIKFHMVSGTDFKTIHPNPAGGRIDYTDVAVNDQDDIRQLLFQRGMLPSIDTYTLIYRANPQLRNLDQLSGINHLRMPELMGSSSVHEAIQSGFFASPVIDSALRSAIIESVNRIHQVQNDIQSSANRLIGTNADKEASLDLLGRIALAADIIRTSLDARPESTTILKHVNGEIDVAAYVAALMLQNKRVQTNDIKKLNDVYSNLAISVQTFGSELGPEAPPPRWRSQPVRAIVRSVGAAQELNFYLIRYESRGAYEAQPDKDYEQFPRSTPNAEDDVPEGWFYFWAVKEGEAKRTCIPVLREIRMKSDSRPFIIELQVSGASK